MNGADIVLIIIIAAAIVFAVRSVIKQSKRGGCCGDCAGCVAGCKKLEARDKKL